MAAAKGKSGRSSTLLLVLTVALGLPLLAAPSVIRGLAADAWVSHYAALDELPRPRKAAARALVDKAESAMRNLAPLPQASAAAIRGARDRTAHRTPGSRYRGGPRDLPRRPAGLRPRAGAAAFGSRLRGDRSARPGPRGRRAKSGRDDEPRGRQRIPRPGPSSSARRSAGTSISTTSSRRPRSPTRSSTRSTANSRISRPRTPNSSPPIPPPSAWAERPSPNSRRSPTRNRC